MAVRLTSFPIGKTRRRRLVLPAGAGAPRIAQVNFPSSLFETAHYFAARKGSGLEEYRPQILVGSAPSLATLADAASIGQLKFPDLRFAVYSITGCRDTPLSAAARTSLWDAFGVPVYEVLLDRHSFPIATECEAQEGWHAEDGVSFAVDSGQLWFRWRREQLQGTGLCGAIESTPCACGRPGKRLLQVGLDLRDPIRRLAG